MSAMLPKEECIRRLRVILTTPPAERPITAYALAELAGMERKRLYGMAGLEPLPGKPDQYQGSINDATQRALSKALLWLENNQVVNGRPAKPGSGKKPPVRIGPPAPPCKLVRRLRFDAKGFRIESTYENPLAFPPD